MPLHSESAGAPRSRYDPGPADEANLEIDAPCRPRVGLSATIGACTVMNPTVTLTPAGISRSVTVLGVDELLLVGDRARPVTTAPRQSDDPNDSGVGLEDGSVFVLEATTAEVQVYPTSGLVTDEDGGSDIFELVLTAIAAANVSVINLDADDFVFADDSSRATRTRPRFLLVSSALSGGVPSAGTSDGAIDRDVLNCDALLPSDRHAHAPPRPDTAVRQPFPRRPGDGISRLRSRSRGIR